MNLKSSDRIKRSLKGQVACCLVLFSFLVLILLFQNCGQFETSSGVTGRESGGTGSDLGGNAGPIQTKYQCTNSEPPVKPLQRLTNYEFKNTLVDLVGSSLLQEARLQALFAQLPSDSAGGYDKTSPHSQESISLFLDFALGIGEIVAQSSSHRVRLLPPCAAQIDSVDVNCVEMILQTFGELVFRRPLTLEEKNFFKGIFSSATGGLSGKVSLLIASLLSSPNFLYHLEVDGADIEGRTDLYRVSEFAMASRLSYLIWGTMPDKDLFADAKASKLVDSSSRRAVVDRLLNDPRSRQHLVYSFKKWLRLDDTPAFSFLPEVLSDIRIEGLREVMINEAIDYFNYIVWEKEGNFQDLMTSSISYVRSSELAKIYGVTPETTGKVDLGADRPGLLTRSIILAKDGHYSAAIPVKRGLFVLENMMCRHLVRPNPSTLPEGALDGFQVNPGMSLRQVIEGRTNQASCIGCHSQINPIGFSFDGFDAIGRKRSMEVVFDEVTGEELNRVPVNSSGEVTVDKQIQSILGVGELAHLLANSQEAKDCFIHSIYKALERRDVQSDSGCFLAPMAVSLGDANHQGNIRSMVESIAVNPLFSLRKMGESQ